MVLPARRNSVTIPGQHWWQSNLVLSLGSGLLLWAAFPPVGLAALAWIAPVGWLILVRQRKLLGRRPYRSIWLGAALYWSAMLVGITFAHWLNIFGWLVLCSYLAVYVPIFVGLSRFAVHRLRVPLMLAAPVVWTGLELLRGHLFTGFSLALLGHSQFEWTALIQLADFLGAYGVSFLVMFVAACLTEALPLADSSVGRVGELPKPRGRIWPVGCAAIALAAAVAYGRAGERFEPQRFLKVALIQKTFNTRFVFDPEHNNRVFREYRDLTLETRAAHPDLDLIIWPESVFTANWPELIVEGPLPDDVDPTQAEQLAQREAHFHARVLDAAAGLNQVWSETGPQQLDISLLVGTETFVVGDRPRQYNTALMIDPGGEIRHRYYKMHPVMFGEYIPLAHVFPWIYSLTPMARGLTPGEGPRCFELKNVRIAPSICFESTVPHLIRGQVVRLTRAGRPPDVLVNVTHDGWFWGSAILDLQLACGVFRSVELRRPFLVAANAGISAWIDDNGRIQQRGPRAGQAVIIAKIGNTRRTSWYARHGDVPAGLCLLACAVLVVLAAAARLRMRTDLPE